MSDRLQVLILSAEPPYPPTYGGARIRLYHLIKQLAPQHDLTLLTLLETPEDRDFLPFLQPFCRKILAFDHPEPTERPSLRDRLRAPAYRLSYSRPMAVALINELRDGNYTLVHADTSRMAVYTPLLQGHHKIIAATDSATLALRNQTPLARGFRAQVRARYLQSLVTRYERTNYREYDAGVTVATRDAEVIRHLCPALPVTVIPNGVNPDFFNHLPTSAEDDLRLIFTGTLDYDSNVDAVLWFTRQILPSIRGVVPQAHFHVVGRNPTSKILDLVNPSAGVTVAGFIPDLRPALALAAVYVCPLRMGAGMKNKLLEAMAMGKAIVTTSEGASGNVGRDGQHFLVADDPADFAAAVVTLLRDPQRRQELGAAAQQLVRENYSWERAGAAFHQLYLDVAGGRQETVDRGQLTVD